MYTVVEIDKTGTFLGTFTPYAPYVFKSIITVGGTYEIADYWTNIFGADGTFNETEKNITGVVLNSVFDVEMVDTLGDLLNQVNSFYFDYDNQELYIHFPHFWGQQSVSIATGQGWGYCSDTVRYFRNQIYRPIVKSIPSLGDSIDPLQYGIIAFGGGSVTLVNDGSFDKDEKLYGNNIRIKRGKEGDEYDDLILMFSGYIKDYTTSTQEFTIDIADKRERLQIEHPSAEIEILDKYVVGEGWEKKSKILPDGYGEVIQVKAYPVEIVGSNITFKWGEKVTSISQVYVENDTLNPIAHGNFSTGGTFTLTVAQAGKDGDATKGILNVYVSGIMRNITNPAEIIVDLNSRLFETEYNNSNYDIAELEAEKALLADVSLYMDKSKKVYEWIQDLQNGTNYGFRYEDTEKRTIRLDDPTRSVVAEIQPIDIRNSDIPIKRNAELYASSVLVRYAKNWRSDSYQSVENKDFESAVLDEHRVKKVQDYDSLLMNKPDADEKALIVISDVHKVRPIVTIRVDSTLYPQPRIFDMIDAQVSVLGQADRNPDLRLIAIGDEFLIGDDDKVIGEPLDYDGYRFSLFKREYFGQVAGQVVGISWLTETDEVELQIRVRGNYVKTMLYFPQDLTEGELTDWDNGKIASGESEGTRISPIISLEDAYTLGASKVSWEGQEIGNVLEFDGASYCYIPRVPIMFPVEQIRVEIIAHMDEWKWISGSATYRCFFSCMNNGGVSIGPNNTGLSTYLRVAGSYRKCVINYGDISNGTHLFTMTYDGRYQKIYLDGELKDVWDGGSVRPISYGARIAWLIGADPNNANNPTAGTYFNGVLLDIKLFADAEGKNLVAHYPLNEGEGSIAHDIAGNNDGTINGATWLDVDAKIKNETAISLDGTNFEQYKKVINNGEIPDIKNAKAVKLKTTLSTNDVRFTPTLKKLDVEIEEITLEDK